MSIIEDFIDNALTTRLPYPKVVSIEPINICQLKCPLCPTGTQKLNYERSVMSFQTFSSVLEKMPFVRIIDLYKSGEPFLNPDIFAMVRHAHDRNIDVIISTHFSFPADDEFFENIVTSGLTRLVISLDGTSQKSYSQYRRGGNYALVMANILKLIEAKNRMHSSMPTIVWQFLVNRFNEHEIPAAENIAREMKIMLDVRPMGLSDDVPDVELEGTIQERKKQWLPKNEKYISDSYKGEYRYPLSPGICTQLFTRVVVAVDGKILPCCEVWDKESAFGDLMTETFEAIWYGRKYMDARRRFLQKDYHPENLTVCSRCHNYSATHSFGDKLRLALTVFRKNISHCR